MISFSIQWQCVNTAGKGVPLPRSLLAAGQLEATGQPSGRGKAEASLLQFQLSKSARSETGPTDICQKRS